MAAIRGSHHGSHMVEVILVNAAEITALATGIPAILAALTALVWAVRGKAASAAALSAASHAVNAITTHVVQTHNAFPIQPPTETETPVK